MLLRSLFETEETVSSLLKNHRNIGADVFKKTSKDNGHSLVYDSMVKVDTESLIAALRTIIVNADSDPKVYEVTIHVDVAQKQAPVVRFLLDNGYHLTKKRTLISGTVELMCDRSYTAEEKPDTGDETATAKSTPTVTNAKGVLTIRHDEIQSDADLLEMLQRAFAESKGGKLEIDAVFSKEQRRFLSNIKKMGYRIGSKPKNANSDLVLILSPLSAWLPTP